MNDADRKKRLSFAIFWAMWQREISPPKLAKAINKSADTVRRWRDGESSPSALDIGPLAEALGVRVGYFTHPPDVPPYPFDDFAVDAAAPGAGWSEVMRDERARLHPAEHSPSRQSESDSVRAAEELGRQDLPPATAPRPAGAALRAVTPRTPKP